MSATLSKTNLAEEVRRTQLERDAFLNSMYLASSGQSFGGFNHAEQTMASGVKGRCITQTELEMSARYINQPGGVQPFGAFLLVAVQSSSSMSVIGCSANTEDLLGVAPDAVIGSNVCQLFEEAASVKKAIESPQDMCVRTISATPKSSAGKTVSMVNLIIMQSAQGVSIDVEPCSSEPCPAEDENRVKEGIKHIETVSFNKQEMSQAVVDEIQQLAGYDRVMLYSFHEDMHGEVVAEATAKADVRSYKHLHFPATDIPQRSRDLYLLNRARIIVDSSATPAPLICSPDQTMKPDSVSLSISTTRAVHPCHLEYLQNWGVHATLVLSVRVSGKLWGLVCCNHETGTRFVSYEARMACASIVDSFATRLSAILTEEKQTMMTQFDSRVSSLLAACRVGNMFNLAGLVSKEADVSLVDLIPDCHGAALVAKDGTVHTIGVVPTEEQVLDLARWRLTAEGSGVAGASCIKNVYQGDISNGICGLLSIPLLNGSVVLWFRKELQVDIMWSGNPNESRTRIPGSTFLPATSFDTFIQTVKGISLQWGSKSVALASEFADKLDSAWADASEQCILAIDMGGRIIRFNDRISEVIGLHKRQVIGSLLSKLCPIGGNLLDGLNRITANGPHDVYISLRPEAASGRSMLTIEMLGCAHPLADCTGNRIILFVGDVVKEGAERDGLAATMDELCSEGFFDSYQDARNLLPNVSKVPLEIPHQLSVLNKVRLPCWLMETDPQNHRFVWGNEAACACFGKTFQEFVCMDLAGVKTLSEQLNLHDWHYKLQKKQRILPTRKTFFPENRPVTFDLEVHPAEAIILGEKEPKTLAFVVGMPVLMQDTGQIEAGRSHEMLQQSRIMTMLFTMKGKLIQANIAARAHYLIDTPPDVLHHDETLEPNGVSIRTVFESCVWESEEAMEACMADMFATCTASSTFEIEVLKQHGFMASTVKSQAALEGGKEHALDAVHLIQCFFARDPLTGERCVLINETDISRMKGVQVDLIMSKRKQEQFLASVSHELRTPLNGILGLSQSLFADPEATEKMKKTLRIIMSSGHRLSSLVNDILDATSMKESRFLLNYQQVSFKDVVDHVVYAIMPMVGRQVTLINDVPAGLPLIHSDPDRLSQVLTNLLGNSVKFTHQGHIRVHAECTATFLSFSVSDSGIGIPQEKFKEIFEPFVKGDMSSTWNYSGSGLGLSVVKSLVEAFGGVISLKSSMDTKDHGTTFTVKLPLKGTSGQGNEAIPNEDLEDAGWVPDEGTSAATPREKTDFAQLLTAQGPLRSMLYSHKSAGMQDNIPEQPSGPMCVLLCLVGGISADSADKVVGSYTRAMVRFRNLLDKLLVKHGARTASPVEEEYVVVARSDMQHRDQLQSLHAFANALLEGCLDITYIAPWSEGEMRHVEVKLALSCGALSEGVMTDGTLVVFGPSMQDAWALLRTAPNMQVHFSESCVDGLKLIDSNLTFMQDYRTTDEATQERVPERCYLQGKPGDLKRTMDSSAFHLGTSDTVWSQFGSKVDEQHKSTVNFALGLAPETSGSSTSADFETAVQVIKKHKHLNMILNHHMSAQLLARGQQPQTAEKEDDSKMTTRTHSSQLMTKKSLVTMPECGEEVLARCKSGHAFKNHNEIYGKIEIMSVDDDPINQMVIENLLAPYGYVLSICMHGLQALELIHSRGFLPDLVLLDVMMPHLSGYEVCEKLRATYGATSLPILMISAKVDHESIVKCFKSGGNDFVHKPFNREELLARITMQLDMRKMWEMQVENKLSLSMLRTMMPEHVVARLQRGEHDIVDRLDEVTILFADIVSYTDLSTRVGTHDLVRMLNAMFTKFDFLCDAHRVTKVETIGDAYMIVAQDDEHAVRMVGMAIDMIRTVRCIPCPDAPDEHVEIRIGIHSGPVIAGVLGERMLRYSYIGETVNLASRMESNGFPMNVVMSEATKELICHTYDVVDLGDYFIKGKGKMNMWLLQSEEVEWQSAIETSEVTRRNSFVANKFNASPARSRPSESWDRQMMEGANNTGHMRNADNGTNHIRTSDFAPPPPRSTSNDWGPDPSPLPSAISDSTGHGVPYMSGENSRRWRFANNDSPPETIGSTQGRAPQSVIKQGVRHEEDAHVSHDHQAHAVAERPHMRSAQAQTQSYAGEDRSAQTLAVSYAGDDRSPRRQSGLHSPRSRPVQRMREDLDHDNDQLVNIASPSISVAASQTFPFPGASEVSLFLARIGMSKVAASFENMGITSIDLIEDMGELDLIRLGVPSIGEQIKLKKCARVWCSAVQCGLIPRG